MKSLQRRINNLLSLITSNIQYCEDREDLSPPNDTGVPIHEDFISALELKGELEISKSLSSESEKIFTELKNVHSDFAESHNVFNPFTQ